MAIRAFQHLADTNLRERPGHRGNRPWFTGYPVRDFADLLPAETPLFFRFAPRARTAGGDGSVLGVFFAQELAGKPFTVV